MVLKHYLNWYSPRRNNNHNDGSNGDLDPNLHLDEQHGNLQPLPAGSTLDLSSTSAYLAGTPNNTVTPATKYDVQKAFKRSWRWITPRRVFMYQAFLIGIFGLILIGDIISNHEAEERAHTRMRNQASLNVDLSKRWGWSDGSCQQLKVCYIQERRAWLLSVFLGWLGIDQWYTHHWILAVFKTLTLGGFGIWWFIDIILWGVGGVYGTPHCPGGFHGPGGGGDWYYEERPHNQEWEY